MNRNHLNVPSDSDSLLVTDTLQFDEEQLLLRRLKEMNKQESKYCGNGPVFVAAFVEQLSVS